MRKRLNSIPRTITISPPKQTRLTRAFFAAKMVYTIVVHLYAKEGKEVEEKLRNKLIEASQVYSKDKETIGWHIMQDHKDPRAWCIVERYEHESV